MRSPSPTQDSSSLHVMGIIAVPLARQPERQRDIVEGRKMIQQPEILEHHADAAAQGRQVAAPGGGQFGAEQGDQAAAMAARRDRSASEAWSCPRPTGRSGR